MKKTKIKNNLYPHKSYVYLQGYRVTRYVSNEVITDPEEVLEKFDSVVNNDNVNCLRDIREHIDVQDLNLRTVKAKLAKQEHSLMRLR